MVFLLSFILVVAAIFVGKGKGLALWAAGSVALYFLYNQQAQVMQACQDGNLPIVLFFAAITAVSILISRWWGLIFYFVASFAGTVLVFFYVLATTQIH